eukprot:4729519-Ditylum_brightwellii.AAC.1
MGDHYLKIRLVSKKLLVYSSMLWVLIYYGHVGRHHHADRDKRDRGVLRIHQSSMWSSVMM